MAHEGAAAKRPEPSKHWPVRYLTVLGWGHSGARMYRDHLLEDSPNPGRSAARQPTGGPRGSVLVVEDDALLALALEDALLDAGFSVCAVAASEEQAVSDALTHRPAFAVVDVRLLSGCGRKVASVLACQFGT